MNDSRPWLKPLGLIYGGVMEWRNQLYDRGVFKSHEITCPVISIGNLTVGGAGKTPVTMALLKKFIMKGQKPGVVSRGYGRSTSEILEVDLKSKDGAALFGDEPFLIKTRYENVPVYVGVKRVDAALKLFNDKKPQVILADDAFQHRALKRQLDLVVIDATQSLESLNPMPWGMARESSSAIRRAQVVVLNKVNLASPEQLKTWRTWLGDHLHSTQNLVEAGYTASSLQSLKGGRAYQAKEWLACAGVARPQAFLQLLRQELKLNVTTETWFADHHAFSEQDLQKVASLLRPHQGVVITEKDAVKWRGLNHSILDQVCVAALDLKWLKGEEALDRALTALIR